MSVTTTANPATYNLQSVLADYDLHHTEDTHDPRLNAHPEANTSAQNPSHWPTEHRRVPAYRPINTALDQSERRVYLNAGERVFIIVMFTGIYLESVSSGDGMVRWQCANKNAGRIKDMEGVARQGVECWI